MSDRLFCRRNFRGPVSRESGPGLRLNERRLVPTSLGDRTSTLISCVPSVPVRVGRWGRCEDRGWYFGVDFPPILCGSPGSHVPGK